MYPSYYFHNLPQQTKGNEVFVAMPFSNKFDLRWKQVYQKAIRDVGLEPLRVDVSKISDSILIEILRGIDHARLVLADVTSVVENRPNGNVLYELGLAHARRIPETVIVVRSDRTSLPFDLRHIRVNSFDSTKTRTARMEIADLLSDSLRETKVIRDEVVERAWKSMGPVCRYILSTRWFGLRGAHEVGFRLGAFAPPVEQNGNYGRWSPEEARNGFEKLSQLGVIEGDSGLLPVGPQAVDPPIVYQLTTLGEEVAIKYVRLEAP